jgi:hypothetical protein
MHFTQAEVINALLRNHPQGLFLFRSQTSLRIAEQKPSTAPNVTADRQGTCCRGLRAGIVEGADVSPRNVNVT